MLRVAMVSDHGCIRVFKEAAALISKGFLVDVFAHGEPFGYNRFTTLSFWEDADQLRRTVKASSADLFHVHNEPDWMVETVRQATDKPIVFDVHDLASLGADSDPDDDERKAFEYADAFVHVSQPCADAAIEHHGNHKPSIILPSYVNEEFIQDIVGEPSWHSVVYEGGLSSDPNASTDEQGREWMNMRYWVPIVKALVDQGFNVMMMCASANPGLAYDQVGAFVVRNVHYPTMLRAMRPYAFGIVGALRWMPLMAAALPNKLFEYMSQGVVPLVFNADESARWVTEHGVGVVPAKDDGSPIADQIVEAGKQARKNIIKKRHQWTMESQIDKLIDLYQEVL